jgi:thioredoxin 1
MAVIEITEENFDKMVVENELPMLLDFWAQWCGPCQMQGPVIEKAQEEYKEKLAFGKVNVDEQPTLAEKYGVMSIPTLIVFHKGEVVKKEIGLRTIEEIGDLIP